MAIPSGYSLLGRIGYNDRGVYTESSDYVRGDVVYHEGSSYVALTTVTGVTPADDNTNWKYLARGFGATELSEIDATDTSGFAGDAGKKVKGQTLIDKIAEYVMSKVVATDAFQTYLQKFLVDNCVTERSDLSLSAAQGKALQDQLATLNSNLGNMRLAVITGTTKPSNGNSEKVPLPSGFTIDNAIILNVMIFNSQWYNVPYFNVSDGKVSNGYYLSSDGVFVSNYNASFYSKKFVAILIKHTI